MLKAGQVLGALVIVAGAGACVFDRIDSTPFLMLLGITLYCGCWLGALVWPRDDGRSHDTETRFGRVTQTHAD